MKLNQNKKELFFNLFQKAPMAFAAVHPNGGFLKTNNYFSQLLGYSTAELETMNFADITHPEDLSKDVELFKRLMNKEIFNFDIEKRYISKDGKVITGKLFVSLEFDTEGEIDYAIAIVQDISKQKESEKAIKSNQHRYKAILENSNNLICRYTPDFILTYTNIAFNNFFNIKEEEPTDTSVLSLVTGEKQVTQFLQLTKEINHINPTISLKIPYYDKKKKWYKWCITGIFNDEHAIVEFQCIIIDITKEKEEKDAIEHHNKLLKKQSEQIKEANIQLTEVSSLFNSIQESAKTGIWKYNVSSDSIFWSDQVYKILEMDAVKSISVEENFSFYHPDHQIIAWEHFCDAVQQQKSIEYELKIITEKGNARWIRVIGKPIFKDDKLIALEGIFQDINDKKIAQLQAQQRQENINAIIENTPDLIWSVDSNYKIIIANSAYKKTVKRFFNFSLSEGDDVLFDLLSEDSKSLMTTYYSRAFEGESFRAEYIHFAGQLFIYDLSFAPIYEDQKIIGVNVIARDLTDKKQKELIYKKQQDFLSQVQKDAKIGAWRWNKNTDEIEFNETLLDIFEFNPAEVTTKNILQLMRNMIHPEDRKKNQEIRKKYIDANLPFSVIIRIVTKNRKIKFLKFIGGECVKDGFSDDIFQIGSTQDITDLMQKELSLLESYQQVDALMHNPSLGIGMVDFNGKILRFNEAMVNMLGYSKNEFLHQNIMKLTHPADKKYSAGFIKQIYTNNLKAFSTEKRYIKKNGEILWAHLNISLVMNEHDKPAYMIGQIQDITHRKSEEKRIKNIVEEKTSQLTAKNKELESFSYSVSHDLRAPLRSINGFSEILLEDYQEILDDEGKLYLSKINKASIRMGELIDDLLILSRISRQELNLAPLDLTALAKEVTENIDIKENYPKTIFCVEEGMICNGDKKLIKIFLENLISNACKFSSRKSAPMVTIGKYCEPLHDVFYIKDNGVGFNMDLAENLFQTFQRLHPDDGFEGTGIGLATVKKIIEKHNGGIWAEGKENEGATFYFKL